jgi:hypothetical protein
VGLGITHVHTQQVPGENRRLIPAGAGAHFQEDVLFIARIARDQQASQLCLGGRQQSADPLHFLRSHVAHGRIRVRGHLLGGRKVRLQGAVGLKAFCQGLQARVFHRQFAKLL